MTDCEMYVKFRTEIDSMYAPEVLKQCQVIRIADGKTEIGMMCVNDGYIDCLYILPEHRKQGHGRKAVLAYIKKHGMLRDLHILNTNPIAKAFWESIFELEVIEANSIDTYYKITALKGDAE